MGICDMDTIRKLAREHDLYVVEDAAESHGAEYKGRKAGGIGHVCFPKERRIYLHSEAGYNYRMTNIHMRYIVEVEELSAEVLEKLKKNSRMIHIFSLIDNTIALETENVERIKELRGVKRVYESGKAKLVHRDALNIIGILDVHNGGFYGDGVWIGVIDSGIEISDPLVSGSFRTRFYFCIRSPAIICG